MKKYVYIIAALFAAVSCAKENGFVEPEELGVKEKKASLESAAGEYVIDVLSDGEFTVSLDENQWVAFKDGSKRSIQASGDCSVTLLYDVNRGIERTAVVTLTRGRKTVDVSLTQSGLLSSDIAFDSHSCALEAPACSYQARIVSIYKDNELNITTEYAGDASGWICNLVKENNYLNFDVLENASDSSRSAFIVVSCLESPDKFDRFQVVQLGKNAAFTDKTFGQIRALLSANGSITITDNLVITGWNIGDNKEGNGGENANISAILQDLDVTARTIYVQNKDASLGFRIVFNEVQDNILSRFEKLRFNLKGVTLTRKGGADNDPVRYEISGAVAANILQTSPGSQYDIVNKEKTISTLKDEDVYTFVTLTDCEIPIRKGPFVPMDLSNAVMMHSYPMVLRDKKGYNTYIMTNTTAVWQRDGKVMPQGSGSVSGVIVHENCDNFEWDKTAAQKMRDAGILEDYVTNVGNIGKYQIRPFARDDIKLAEDFKNGFSEMIMEIRYFGFRETDPIVPNVKIVKGMSDEGKEVEKYRVVYPTYPAVENPMDLTDTFKLILYKSPAESQPIYLSHDWTHLGPMSAMEITDPERGNGVEDVNGVKSEWSPYAKVTTTGGIWKSSAWFYNKNWSTKLAWTAMFSTKDLTSAKNAPISVQIGCCNGDGTAVRAPRYWIVEYYTDGFTSWKQAGSYTCPDFPLASNRRAWQCPAYKYVTINLPDDKDIFGKNLVRVRLRPSENKAGGENSYDGSSIQEESSTQLNYFAIRYNK